MLAVALMMASAHANTLREDIKTYLGSPALPEGDNRIGFSFASLCIGSDDGQDSTIAGSTSRIASIAHVMQLHPNTRLVVEGHVGVSAPPEIAQSYSEARAHIIAHELEQMGVSPCRLATRGWGSRVSSAAIEAQTALPEAAASGSAV